jgi:ligand-binding sensor domain-containing protein
MMIKRNLVCALLLAVTICMACKGQAQTDQPKNFVNTAFSGPKWITRNVIQDRAGNIWIAAFDGVFKYDGKSFTNITSQGSSARFFSVLEDRKGNLWFGSIGSGVFRYDGKSFKNFTIKNGLLNNGVVSIYEDKKGDIWFGVSGGVSRYDGTSFRNYIINGASMNEDPTGKTFPNGAPFEVNSIIEDKTGKLWFATRGNTFVYDKKIFIAFTRNGKPFTNVRSIIEDKRGNIWLGGQDGLWHYDGKTFTNFTREFTGYIYEDKNGNIYTSSASAFGNIFINPVKPKDQGWVLARYNEKSLYKSASINSPVNKSASPKVIANKAMVFGIVEAGDGGIWFGAMDGVYRYDGNTVIDFKLKQGDK